MHFMPYSLALLSTAVLVACSPFSDCVDYDDRVDLELDFAEPEPGLDYSIAIELQEGTLAVDCTFDGEAFACDDVELTPASDDAFVAGELEIDGRRLSFALEYEASRLGDAAQYDVTVTPAGQQLRTYSYEVPLENTFDICPQPSGDEHRRRIVVE